MWHTRKKKKKPRTFNQSGLAKQLNISHQRVSALIRDEAEPWPWGKGPWTEAHLPAIKAWLNARRATANATSAKFDDDDAVVSIGDTDTTEQAIEKLTRNPLRQAQIAVLIERAATLKQKRELAAGGWLKAAEVEQQNIAKIYAVKNAMMEAGRRLALALERVRDPVDVRQIVDGEMRYICTQFSQGQKPYAEAIRETEAAGNQNGSGESGKA